MVIVSIFVVLVCGFIYLCIFVRSHNEKWLFKKIPRKPRFLNAIVARCGSYYWLPCSGCGRKYAGYESQESIATWQGGYAVCYRCSEKAKKINAEYFKRVPPPPVYM